MTNVDSMRAQAAVRRLLVVAILAVIGLVVFVVLNLPTARAAIQGALHRPSDVISDVHIVPAFAFNPASVVITAGTTVQWLNDSGFTHTSTSDITGTVTSWDSLGIGPGGVFTLTYVTPGTYTYHCTIHPFMTGSITVIAPVIYMPILYRESVL